MAAGEMQTDEQIHNRAQKVHSIEYVTKLVHFFSPIFFFLGYY